MAEREVETAVELNGRRITVRGYVGSDGTVEILEQSRKVIPAEIVKLAEALVSAAGEFEAESLEDALLWHADKERAA